MGFSLEAFFEEVLSILSKDQTAEETVTELAECFKGAREYAAQCGQIPKELGEDGAG
jgi:hypothetical protein